MESIRVWKLSSCCAVAAALTLLNSASDTTAQEPQLSLEEDYAYPFANEILAQTNIELIRGDGHLLLVDCNKPHSEEIGHIRIQTSDVTVGTDGLFCLEMSETASSGYLALEVHQVYEIRNDGRNLGLGHALTVQWEVDNASESGEVPRGGTLQIGSGADPSSGAATLLELRARR